MVAWLVMFIHAVMTTICWTFDGFGMMEMIREHGHFEATMEMARRAGEMVDIGIENDNSVGVELGQDGACFEVCVGGVCHEQCT